MNSKLKMGLKGVVIVAAIQVVAMPVTGLAWTEEIHGFASNTQNPGDENVFLGMGLDLGSCGGGNIGLGIKPFGDTDKYCGGNNIAIGKMPLYSNENGTSNIAIGLATLYENDSGESNIAIGSESLKSNVAGHSNVAIGGHAMSDNILGSDNVAIGRQAMGDNKQAIDAVYNAGIGGPRFTRNIAVGANSMWRHAGVNNVAVGADALAGLSLMPSKGSDNVALGWAAGVNNEGSRNVYIGAKAGGGISDGNGNVLIGYKAGSKLPKNSSNKLVIANGEKPSEQLIVGDFFRRHLKILGKVVVSQTLNAKSFNTTSDARLKKDIQPIDDALSSVLQLQGKSYRWNEDEDKQDIGLIAQDVEQIFPQLVAEDANGFKAIAYSRLTAVLVEAIKEQQGQIGLLQQENRELKSRIDSELSLLLSRVSVLEGVPLAQR